MTFYHENSFQKLAEVDKINFFLFIQHYIFCMVLQTCNGDVTGSYLDQDSSCSSQSFI